MINTQPQVVADGFLDKMYCITSCYRWSHLRSHKRLSRGGIVVLVAVQQISAGLVRGFQQYEGRRFTLTWLVALRIFYILYKCVYLHFILFILAFITVQCFERSAVVNCFYK